MVTYRVTLLSYRLEVAVVFGSRGSVYSPWVSVLFDMVTWRDSSFFGKTNCFVDVACFAGLGK